MGLNVGNRQLSIGSGKETHPLPRGGTDFMPLGEWISLPLPDRSWEAIARLSVPSAESAKMADEPERPDKIAAVLKLFEVQGHHDLEEFRGRIIEAHHGGSNGAGGSSRR
jgi:hypothetical protein